MDKFHRVFLIVVLAAVAFLASACSLLTADRTAELEASAARRELYDQRADASDELVRNAAGISEEKREAILAAGARVDEDYAKLAEAQESVLKESGRLDWQKLYEQAKALRERNR